MTSEEKTVSKKLSILIHLVCWGLILHLIFDFQGLYYSFYELFILRTNFVDEAFLLIPLMVVLFYANSHFLLPQLLAKKKVLLYVVGLTGLYLMFIGVGYSIYLFLVSFGFEFREGPIEIQDILIATGIPIVGVSSSVGLAKIVQENTKQKKMAEQERKKAELKYLSAQINPHFLFNTLNTIYSLATDENAPKTTEAILKLSEMMRYPINEGAQKHNYVLNEISFIKDYVDLQKIRLGSNYPIHFEVIGNFDRKKIAPFLFVPLIENAFKYGISRANPKPIRVNLGLFEQHLVFTVENTKTSPENVKSNGVGILNLQERLKIIYPDCHEFKISESTDLFKVELLLHYK